ncbi:MAG: FlgD immunoglobulin-like domain containing protein, partial [Candidatus Kryptoniota bacterium]
DSAHGIVWKVLVDGIDPQDQRNLMNPIGVGPHRFDVYFNRPMDTVYTPQLSFGVRPPFNQQGVTDSARWSPDHKVWTAYKTVKLYTGDGINTIRVAGARDLEGFEIPIEDMRFSFLIDAAGTSSTDFVATAGLGKIRLDWVKPDVSDILGYNLYRFNNVTDTTYSDTTLISKTMVTDTTYTDFDITPGKNYYYAYKVVRTDFTESDYSKFVGTKALTSKPGDSNGDFSVDVLDVIADVSYILGQKPAPFIFGAADVNGDSVINVLDIVGTINIILHPSSTAGRTLTLASNTKSERVEARIDLTDDKVWLNSPVAVAGIQLKIAGCKDPGLFEYMNGFDGLEVATAKVNGDTIVVLAYSLKGNSIPAGKIALLKSKAKDFSVISAVLSGVDGNAISAKIYNNGIPLIPESFMLFQNYPNPFNPSTTIRYGLPDDVSNVELIIYNILGQKVRTIEQGSQKKGYHEVIWDGRNNNGLSVASGVYFCQARIWQNNTLKIIGTTKMMVLR